MATRVVKTEKVTLQDGSVVEVRPLNIKNLRKFMEVTKKFEKAKDDTDGLDLLLEAVEIALKAADAERFEGADLEELLDIDSIGQIMRVAGGVDINQDPNLLEATA